MITIDLICIVSILHAAIQNACPNIQITISCIFATKNTKSAFKSIANGLRNHDKKIKAPAP